MNSFAKSFALNTAIGLTLWALFYLCLYLLNGTLTNDVTETLILLAGLVVSIVLISAMIAPLSPRLARHPRCGILLVSLFHGYFGALTMTVIGWGDAKPFDWTAALINPAGVFLYTFPYAIAIVLITVIAYKKYYRQLSPYNS